MSSTLTVTNEKEKETRGMIADAPLTTNELIQYCLDNGMGIQYEEYAPEQGYTTEREKANGGKPRYVSQSMIESYKEGVDDDQLTFAVRNSVCTLDLDEWMALQKALGVKICLDVAYDVNAILWEELDLSPLEFGAPDYGKLSEDDVKTEEDAIRLMMDSDITDEIAQRIASALRAYGISALSLVQARIEANNERGALIK